MEMNGEYMREYDAITLTIRLKAGDEVWVRYYNSYGKAWTFSMNDAYFTGTLLYKI